MSLEHLLLGNKKGIKRKSSEGCPRSGLEVHITLSAGTHGVATPLQFNPTQVGP